MSGIVFGVGVVLRLTGVSVEASGVSMSAVRVEVEDDGLVWRDELSQLDEIILGVGVVLRLMEGLANASGLLAVVADVEDDMLVKEAVSNGSEELC